MEKINLSLLFIAILAISLGCGSDDDDDETDTSTGSGGGGTDTGTGTGAECDGGPCSTDTGVPADEIDISACTTSTPSGPTELLASFEGGSSMADCEGCMGVYTYDDGTGVMEPGASYGAQAPVRDDLPSCTDNGKVFCVSTTTGFEHWGTGWRLDFVYAEGQDPARAPRDLTGYRGVGFWGLLLDGPAGIKVGFPDTNTDVAGGLCYDATNLEPSWEVQINRPREEKLNDCENDWGQQRLLEKNKWIWVEVLFEDAYISPFWGRQVQDDGLLIDQVYGVKFQRDATATPYTVCIDDLMLLK